MGINIKELCKQIKKSRGMVWSVKDNIHYITNRHWAAKFSDLPREVLIQLFAVFTQIPQEGETISYDKTFDEVRKANVNIEQVFIDQLKESAVGEITPFVKMYDEKTQLRIIKVGKNVIYVREEYMKIVGDQYNAIPLGSNPHKPVSFFDNTVIILPMRVSESKEDATIIELLAS